MSEAEAVVRPVEVAVVVHHQWVPAEGQAVGVGDHQPVEVRVEAVGHRRLLQRAVREVEVEVEVDQHHRRLVQRVVVVLEAAWRLWTRLQVEQVAVVAVVDQMRPRREAVAEAEVKKTVTDCCARRLRVQQMQGALAS